MPSVITMGSNVTCGHAGKVATSGASKLSVNANAVLLKDGIAGKNVSACSTPPSSDVSGPIGIPCITVAAISSGEATKLTVGGRRVMLETLAGSTDGMVGKVTPQLLLSATANQTKLTAI